MTAISPVAASGSPASASLRGRRHHHNHGHHQISTPSASSSSPSYYSATASLRSRSSLLWGGRRPTRRSPHRSSSSSSRGWWVGQKKFMFTLFLLPVSLLAIAGICLLRQYRGHQHRGSAKNTPFRDPHHLSEGAGDAGLRRNHRPLPETSTLSGARDGDNDEKRIHPIGVGGNLPMKRRRRALLVWPTIPVPLKGSDARPLDAIRYLSSPSSGYSIDLLFWRDYATESRDPTYDDSPDRERLVNAGVERVLGPYDDTKLSDSHTYVGGYDLLVYWLWPDVEFLDCVIDAVEWVKGRNGSTKVVAVVDDVGVAARYLIGEVGGKKDGGGEKSTEKKVWTAEDVEGAVLAKRPLHLLGNETSSSTSFTLDDYDVGLGGEVDGEKLFFGTRLLYQEMHLYVSCSDVVVGVNSAATAFLRKMVPGVPVFRLSYVSPVQPKPNGPGGKANNKPFHERENGYIFFGYNNFANNRGLGWFLDSVLPRLANSTASTASGAVLHVAGTVTVPEEYCTCDGFHRRDCTSHQPTKVVCHGAVGDGELDSLVSSVRVAINPVLEPSGVATKTCRAMALGTPVVVTDLDGTFVGVGGEDRGDRVYERSTKTRGGRRCATGAKAVVDGKRGADDDTVDAAADCFAKELASLLGNEVEWKSASAEAPGFIVDNFGLGRYEKDWSAILKHAEEPLERWEVVIDPGENVVFRDGDGISRYSWHLAHELSAFSDLRVTVVTNAVEPTLPGVHVAAPHVPLREEKRRGRWGIWFPWPWLPGHYDYKPTSPSFPTGFQANVIIRVKPTPDHWTSYSIYPLSFCGASCRIVQILSSSHGTLPESWLTSSPLAERVDALWVPSARDRTVHEKCGMKMQRSHIVPVGIDCGALFPLESGSTSASAFTSSSLRKDRLAPAVTFLFSGDFAPRTGIDVLLEEWDRLFCIDGGEASTDSEPKGHQLNAKLVLLTGNEEVLGFSDLEVAAMERISDRCRHTLLWERRRKPKERRSRFVELLRRRRADIFVAPYRSSGVLMDDGVVSVMEAMATGIPVVATVGGALPLTEDDLTPFDLSDTSGNMTEKPVGDDSPHGHGTYYLVKSREVACQHEPCRRGRRLCGFPPCHSSTADCICERVAVEPTWFEMDREDLRVQMKMAYADLLSNRRRKSTISGGGVTSSSAGAEPCWTKVGMHYHKKTLSLIDGPLLRKALSFLPPDPPLSLRLRRIVRFFVRKAKVLLQLVTLSVVVLYLLSWRFPGVWNPGILLLQPIRFKRSGAVNTSAGRSKVN